VQEEILLADLDASAGVVRKNNILYRVLSYHPAPNALNEELGLSAIRFAALEGILRAYRVLNPILSVLGLLAFLVLTIQVIRRRADGPLWMVVAGFAILFLSRVALISFIDVSAMRIPAGAYLWEAHPILLAFVAITLMASVDLLSTARLTLPAVAAAESTGDQTPGQLGIDHRPKGPPGHS
jgi:hypothetical protein